MFSTTTVLRQAAATGRIPMIKFIGKRSIPESLDHNPRVHPESPSAELPANFTSPNPAPSFSSYRQKAQQHGPLGRTNMNGIGSMSGLSLGPVSPSSGEFFDRSELPARFRRAPIDSVEIDAIETAGATLVC